MPKTIPLLLPLAVIIKINYKTNDAKHRKCTYATEWDDALHKYMYTVQKITIQMCYSTIIN